MKFHRDERDQKKEKYNRAKEKREFQKRVDEELDRQTNNVNRFAQMRLRIKNGIDISVGTI